MQFIIAYFAKSATVHPFIASETKLVCAVGSRNGTEITKLMVLDFGESLGENQQIKYVH